MTDPLKNRSQRTSNREPALTAGSVLTRSKSWSFRDFLALTKPEIAFLVGISVLAGFLTGSGPSIDWVALVGATVGTVMASGGAGALNHYFERRHDARMHRTALRPIPSGRIAPESAFRFGALLSASGVALLCPLTNWLTAGLAIATIALYLAVYTPLKRVTVHNTLIGTFPGALPAFGGYTAATGRFGTDGLVVFLVLLLWQLPHFYALAWMYRKDYGRGGFAMLSVNDGTGRKTSSAALVSTVALVLASFLPVVVFNASIVYLLAMTLLNGWILASAIRFYRERTTRSAKHLLKVSVGYIPLYVLAIVFERLW